jgi:integrase
LLREMSTVLEPRVPRSVTVGTAPAWVAQAATFTTVYGTGIRRGELLGLRWRHIRLADPEGPTLRVEETYVRNRVETPKSEQSGRTIPLGPVVADALFEHRARTAYSGDDDRVFCHR